MPISMGEAIVITVAGTIIATAILAATGGLTRLFRIPRHIREWEITIRRASKDCRRDAEQLYRELADKLDQLDEDYNARGIYNSGIHLLAREKAHRAVQERVKDEMTKRDRIIDDATLRLRAVDRAWLALKNRGDRGRMKALWAALTKQPASLERDVLDPVFRRMKDLDS